MNPKIFSAEQIKAWDLATINDEQITSTMLMERAAGKITEYLLNHLDCNDYLVVCGKGNNGGDGLAVARLLARKQIKVSVVVVEYGSPASADFTINFNRLKAETHVMVDVIDSSVGISHIKKHPVIIDALLGTGLNKPVSGLLKETIANLNQSEAMLVAIDIPSGLYCDKEMETGEIAIEAHLTLSFEGMKMAFMWPESARYTGQIQIIPIALSSTFARNTHSNHQLITAEFIRSRIKTRKKFSHKGLYGHLLVMAGSAGKFGAAMLSSKAALRCGCGLLTLHSCKPAEIALNSYLPSAMFYADNHDQHLTILPDLSSFSAVAVGPGIGIHHETELVIKQLIQQYRRPIVYDADALNILAKNPTWLAFLHPNSIITPHPKEFERIAGQVKHTRMRHKLQREFSMKYGCIVVLKGAYTTISIPNGSMYYNTTGNAGMAKGGSGDVLTGMIGSLLAQGYDASEAALMSVYLHGLAGDLAKEKYGEHSFLPEDLIELIGEAYQRV